MAGFHPRPLPGQERRVYVPPHARAGSFGSSSIFRSRFLQLECHQGPEIPLVGDVDEFCEKLE